MHYAPRARSLGPSAFGSGSGSGSGPTVYNNATIRDVLAAHRDRVCDGTFEPPIGTWDVSGVDDMAGLFSGWYEFNQPIWNWDTRNVTTMESMFYRCDSFNQPIGNWDTRNVTTMRSMLEGCMSFNQPLNWDTGLVDDMARMFRGCSSLERTLAFDMSEVRVVKGMFKLCGGAMLVARDPGPDIVGDLKRDLGPDRLSVELERTGHSGAHSAHSRSAPIYTLGPNRGRCYGARRGGSRAQVSVYETHETRLPVLAELRAAVFNGRITGTRPLPEAYAWPGIFRADMGGALVGLDNIDYILDSINPGPATLVVARRMGADGARRAALEGAVLTRSRKRDLDELDKRAPIKAPITAFVRVDLSDEPKDLGVYRPTPRGHTRQQLHDSWRTSAAYVPLVMSSIDAPAGHAAEALAATLQLAKRTKRMLVLRAINSSMLWYLNTCFLADTHQVVLTTRESFEQTRAYALSEREGVDLERTLSEALLVARTPVIAFVFSGAAVLSGMDYGGLMHQRPRDLGLHVRMFRVSAENPLVKGCSYDYMLYSEAGAPGGSPPRGSRGYMYAREEETKWEGQGASRRYGLVRLAGEFVRLDVGAGVAVFKTGREFASRSTEDVGFRRTFENHAIDDSAYAGPRIKVEPEEEEPEEEEEEEEEEAARTFATEGPSGNANGGDLLALFI
jgi:surface protein